MLILLNIISEKGSINLSSVAGAFSELLNAVQKADAAPTQGQDDVYSYYKKVLDNLIERTLKLEALIKKDKTRN